ncbi:MAG TPA: FliG C-terminal domain-containing protein [Polyangia bacterium]|nr:FliG C-terminal domain-containing protein [Polyangia bacterium]
MNAPMTLDARQRAALVLLGLDEDVARAILSKLEQKDVRLLAEAADSLRGIKAEVLEPVFEDFERAMSAPMLPAAAGDYVRQLTAMSIGTDRAQELFSPAAPPSAPLELIKNARTATVAELLGEEHPQVAAVILSQLPRAQAAEILLVMTKEQQSDLLGRIASLETVPPHMVELASEALAKALAAAGALSEESDSKEFDGIAFAAELLNELGPTDSERLLGALGESNAKLAPRIREAMFTFEDLGRIEARQLQPLMREVPSETMLLALKTASEELRNKFLSAVSARAAESMREDLSMMPPTKLSDVEKAQRDVVDTAMKMSQQGKLALPSSGGGEKLV